jgi:Putative zinc-finger
MNCKEVEESIDAYALGALERREAEAVERHLAECGDCRVQFEESRAVVGSLPLAVPFKSAPPALFHRTMADIYRSEAEAENVRWFSNRWLVRNSASLAAAAASVVAVASLAFALNLDGRVDELDETAEEPATLGREQQLVNLAFADENRLTAALEPQEPAAEEGSEVSAVYVWSPEYSVGVLMVFGLSVGRTYQACFESSEGGPRSAGFFRVYDQRGNAQKGFPTIPDDRVIAVGVTEGESCEPAHDWTHYWPLDESGRLPVTDERLSDSLRFWDGERLSPGSSTLAVSSSIASSVAVS